LVDAAGACWRRDTEHGQTQSARILCLRGPNNLPTVPPKPKDCNDRNNQTAAWVALSQRLTACEVRKASSILHSNWSTITVRINAVSLDQESNRDKMNDRSSYFCTSPNPARDAQARYLRRAEHWIFKKESRRHQLRGTPPTLPCPYPSRLASRHRPFRGAAPRNFRFAAVRLQLIQQLN
jgi:hypothetical protein